MLIQVFLLQLGVGDRTGDIALRDCFHGGRPQTAPPAGHKQQDIAATLSFRFLFLF